MNETQTLEAIDTAIAAVQNLQKHSMVAKTLYITVIAENLIMLRQRFIETNQAAIYVQHDGKSAD